MHSCAEYNSGGGCLRNKTTFFDVNERARSRRRRHSTEKGDDRKKVVEKRKINLFASSLSIRN